MNEEEIARWREQCDDMVRKGFADYELPLKFIIIIEDQAKRIDELELQNEQLHNDLRYAIQDPIYGTL